MNAIFIVLGQPGKGKSTAALRMASDLDPNFSIERVAYNSTDFFRLVNQGDTKQKHLSAGSAIVFDEAAGSEDAVDSRRALSNTNQRMAWFTTIARARRLIIFYVCPFLSQLDKRVRLIGVTGILVLRRVDFNNKVGVASFYWTEGYALSDKTIMPNPRLYNKETESFEKVDEIEIPVPADKRLISQYKAMKNQNIAKKSADWQAQILREELKKTAHTKDPEEEREIVRKILKLHESGKSGRQISKELKVSLYKVQKWVVN